MRPRQLPGDGTVVIQPEDTRVVQDPPVHPLRLLEMQVGQILALDRELATLPASKARDRRACGRDFGVLLKTSRATLDQVEQQLTQALNAIQREHAQLLALVEELRRAKTAIHSLHREAVDPAAYQPLGD